MLREALQSFDLSIDRPCAATSGWRGVALNRPAGDRVRPREQQVVQGIALELRHVAGAAPRCRNYYPPFGGLDWHTDSADPGWRVYAWRRQGRESTLPSRFYYVDRVFDEDRIMGAYVFRTGPGCWHALDVHDVRISAGLKVPAEMAQEIIAAAAQSLAAASSEAAS
jgi:hypothetical protein